MPLELSVPDEQLNEMFSLPVQVSMVSADQIIPVYNNR